MRDPSVIRFSELRKVGVHVNRARPRRGHQMQRSGFSKGCQPLAAYRKIHKVLYRTEQGRFVACSGDDPPLAHEHQAAAVH